MKTSKPDADDDVNSTAAPPQGRSLYARMLKIPMFGEILRIANAYAYDGDFASDNELAPLKFWIKKHWANFIIATILTVFSTPHLGCIDWLLQYLPAITSVDHRLVPGSLIIGIFPNLLGFGIGVYALIFGLSSILVKRLQQNLNVSEKNGQTKAGSILMLNSDMAYPLLVMTLSLGIGVLQQIYPNSHMLEYTAWLALWYSMLMVIEILTVLFGLGENELIGKL